MSKKLNGKACVYCGSAPATTSDHIFARGFFPVHRRANLPQVPACAACNGEKSTLEHYLTAVLPFGGTHEDAHEALSEMVPPRLEKNTKLKNILSGGLVEDWREENGVLVPAMTVPFDSDRASELFRFITKGLLYHHWGMVLDNAQGTDIPEMSIWIFNVFGGLKLSGDPDSPDELASVIGGVTASMAALEKLRPILA